MCVSTCWNNESRWSMIVVNVFVICTEGCAVHGAWCVVNIYCKLQEKFGVATTPAWTLFRRNKMTKSTAEKWFCSNATSRKIPYNLVIFKQSRTKISMSVRRLFKFLDLVNEVETFSDDQAQSAGWRTHSLTAFLSYRYPVQYTVLLHDRHSVRR